MIKACFVESVEGTPKKSTGPLKVENPEAQTTDGTLTVEPQALGALISSVVHPQNMYHDICKYAQKYRRICDYDS